MCKQSTLPRTMLAAVLGCVALGVTTGQAVPIATKDGNDFTWKFDFEETPFDSPANATQVLSVFDSYNNTTGALGGDTVADFGNPAGAGSAPTHSDGVLRTTGNFYGNPIWQASGVQTQASTPGAQGYTIEYVVRVSNTSQAEDALGVATYMVANDTIASIGFRLKDNQTTGMQEVYYGAPNGDTATPAATVPIGEWMTIRLAAEPDENFSGIRQYKASLYVNGQLVSADREITFANSAITGRLVFGALGGGYGGLFEMDSLAWTHGAWAPIPEPASLGLLGLGVWMLVQRRRQA